MQIIDRYQKYLGLLGSTAGVVVVQGISASLLFLNGVVLARILSEEGFGAYEYAFAWTEVLLLFAMLGFDRLLIRLVAEYDNQQNWGRLQGIIKYALHRISVFLIIAMPIIGITVALIVVEHPNAVLIISTFWIALFLLPVRVFLKLNQVILQGLRRVVYAYLPDYIIRPILFLLALFFFVDTPQQAYEVHILSAILALIVSTLILQRFLPVFKDKAEIQPDISWLKTVSPFMLISGLTILNVRGGVTLLGLVTDLETVALYSVATRISWIVALALTSVSAVVAPRIPHLLVDKKLDELQKLVTVTSRITTIMALGVIVLFWLFGESILSLFGQEYTEAYYALLILGIGQFIVAMTGVVGWLMMMAGQERPMLKYMGFATISHFVLIFILTPIFGLIGAAIATAIASVIGNIMMSIDVYKRMQINMLFL